MRLATYGGSVSGQARNQHEWFPFGSPAPFAALPNPGLGALGFS
jgi:hypothetical protein